MNNKKLLQISALVLLAALGASTSQAQEVLAGPALPHQNAGWTYTGLQITALQDVTLDSFVFQTDGNNDTIELTLTDGTVLDSVPFTGDGGIKESSTITAGWDLTAGTTYNLVSANDDNSYWNDYSFPVSNDDLTVDGGYGNGSLTTDYWFHFNDLTTGAAVPEPTTMALAGIGIAGMLLARRRK
jgi:hypothetical protein